MFMRELKIESFLKRLEEIVSERILSLDNLMYAECGYKTSHTPNEGLSWKKYDENVQLLAGDRHYWIKGNFKVPSADENYEIYLRETAMFSECWPPQFIVYLNGEPVQGLDENHQTVQLYPNTEYELLLYFYGMPDESRYNIIFDVIKTDIRVEKLYYDLLVPYECCISMDKNSQDYADILKALDYAVNIVDLYDEASEDFIESVIKASEYMDKNFYHGICKNKDDKMYCVGQTHIDVAWLWSLAQTREKVQRSFSTVIRLMEKYPEYIFMCSQPQLYIYIKEEAPEIYEKIKERIKEGRWEVEGAMWLEADCNLLSGESLVRQILHGKKFIKDEFGKDSHYLWLPDVFGYSAALPQILKKCGVDKFLTTKIRANEFNKMPSDTFMWEGLDGSRVLTYLFFTNVDLCPQNVYTRWKENDVPRLYSGNTMIGFGFGDGGGGANANMLEKQRRMAYGIPGMPQTVISTATEFLKVQEKSFAESCNSLRKTPLWKGELYFELHRGTYTSMARVKKNNRKCELLQQKTELYSVIDNILCGGSYPKEQLDKNWKLMLLNQFHDIIPGSSIKKVYDDSDIQYKKVFENGNKMLSTALNNIASDINTDGGVMVCNSNGFDANGIIEYDNNIYYVKNIPAMGYAVIKPALSETAITFKDNVCDTPYYKVVFDRHFNIISLYDKENKREVVSKGEKFNELKVFEDIPYLFEAWDISEYYKDKYVCVDDVTNVLVEDKCETFEIQITRTFQHSLITQTFCFYNNLRRIDVKNHIDWKEKKVLLKAMFPVAVHALEATYDIQFGNIKRSTYSNTSWDRAKFEVCGHKWADISETDYGVAIMNDCKYGYGCELNEISLSLIKCAVYPNPEADKEIHEFTYSILPHHGNFMEADIAKEAYMLNQPLSIVPLKKNSGKLSDRFSFVSCSANNVMIETIKQSEDGDDIILRMYEYHNKHTNAEIDFGFDIKEAYYCDMLENEINKFEITNRKFNYNFSPFEIVTFKIKK